MKNLILDCGGVLVWPRLGEWNLPYGMAAILGERAQDIHTARYLMAHRKAAEWLDESRIIKDVEEERGLRREYVKAMDVYMDWHMTADEIRRLTDDFTDNILRYDFFEDAKEYLPKWHRRYGIGLLSDAMPSILSFMDRYGILEHFDAAVISTHVGAIKPSPKMYAAILEQMGADPADCLFVDDRPCNLEGAVRAGMKAVQMARQEFLPAELWDGPVARDFAALDALLDEA